MKTLTLLLLLTPMLVFAAPTVLSEKEIKLEKDSSGIVLSEEILVKYKGGWAQIITYRYKKGERLKIVSTYNTEGRIVGNDIVIVEDDPPLTAGQAQDILSTAFKKVTDVDYNANEFILAESTAGKPISVWKKKYQGEIIFTYISARQVGCGTASLIEAVEKGLIPK
jgi:hypothetical protein